MAPRLAAASLLALILTCSLAAPAGAETFTVNSTADLADLAVDGTCDADSDAPVVCTLRAAIQEANPSSADDVIIVPPGNYVLGIPGTSGAEAGDLDVLGATTIVGAGARTTTIDANGIDRVFQIGPITQPPVVSISGVTISGGVGSTPGGGGVLVSQGSLTLTDVAVLDNSTAAGGPQGGGIYNLGALTLERSLLSGNDSGISGTGGAIHNQGQSLTIRNSTISGNHGESGGALSDTATTSSRSIAYSTIYGNDSDGGAAVEASDVQIRDSIVAANTSANCLPALVSGGRNIESGATCGFIASGDRQNTDPQLGALANYGGPTDTHRPLSGSPAIDRAATIGCPEFDQRGLRRPGFAACDIGAVELQPPPPPPPPAPARPAFLTLQPTDARRRPGAANVVTATVRNDNGTPAAGVLVRYAIAGPNDGAGTTTTDAAGVARISWRGVRVGRDTLTAYVDSNGNVVHDALVEPLSQATVTWALPRPRQGRSVNIEPVSGVVKIRVPRRRSRSRGRVGAAGAAPRNAVLTSARQVPLRTIVDTRRGRVQMTSAASGTRGLQTGQFYGGMFTSSQSRGGRRPFTELRLTQQLRCVRGRRGASLRTSRRARSRRLWGRVRRRGRFRTRGRYSTAAVRGTVWLQKDSCNTTLTVVREGTVAVRDFARRKTVRVKAGRRYVARRAKRRR